MVSSGARRTGARPPTAAAIVEQIGVEVGVANPVARDTSLRRGRCRGRARAGAPRGRRGLALLAAARAGAEATSAAPARAPARPASSPPAGRFGESRPPPWSESLPPAPAWRRPRRRPSGTSSAVELPAPRLRFRSPRAPIRSGSGRRLRRQARPPLPATGDSISTVALSVIMSASCWSSSTRSPSLTCQATISASAMPSPMSGSLN